MEAVDPLLIDLPECLTGERIVVRPFRAGDGPAVREAIIESRADLLPWMPWATQERSAEEQETYVRRSRVKWDSREDMPVGIFDRVTGQFLGGSGLHRIDWRARAFEIGYWMRSSKTGNGYVTESTWLLTTFAFQTLQANRVFIRVACGNARSEAIPRRLGFLLEGTLRSAIMDADGKLWDCYVFGMTRTDWESRSSA